MAISFVDGGAIGANNANPSMSTPGSIAPGDLMVVVSTRGDGTSPAPVTSGYTQADDGSSAGFAGFSSALFYKLMGGTPDSTITTAGGSFGNCLAFHCYSGVDQVTPMDATTVDSTGTGAAAFASIDTVTNGAQVIASAGTQLDEAGFALSGYSDVFEAAQAASFGRSTTVAITSKNKATAGTESPGSLTGWANSGFDIVARFTSAIRPAASTAGAIANTIRSMASRMRHMLVR